MKIEIKESYTSDKPCSLQSFMPSMMSVLVLDILIPDSIKKDRESSVPSIAA